MEYSMNDRVRLILLGIVTAAICAVMISDSFVHLIIQAASDRARHCTTVAIRVSFSRGSSSHEDHAHSVLKPRAPFRGFFCRPAGALPPQPTPVRCSTKPRTAPFPSKIRDVTSARLNKARELSPCFYLLFANDQYARSRERVV